MTSTSSSRKSTMSPIVSMSLALAGGLVLCLVIVKSNPRMVYLVSEQECMSNLDDLAGRIETCVKDINSQKEKIAKLESSSKNSEKELDDKKKELEKVGKKLAEVEKSNEDLKHEGDQAKEQVKQLQAEKDKLAADLEALKKSVEEQKQQQPAKVDEKEQEKPQQ